MMKYIFLGLVIMVSLFAQAAPVDTTVNKTPFVATMVPQGAYVFYVIGDWGRKGKHHQKNVAAAMNKCAEIVKPAYIVSTGDNFYTFGVTSAKDALWKKSYENIYNGDAIKHVDWYPVLGNHDHYGNEDAEVEYSTINPHWKMVAKHYAAQIKAPDSSTITMVYTNTEPLSNNASSAAQQWQWIDSTLAAAPQGWKFVVGHHPVYSSNPTHGNTPELVTRLKPLLEKYNVQAYLCGHDHDMQHQQPAGSKVDYFVSGAGSELRPTAANQNTKFALSRAGFLLVAIKDNIMTTYFIDEDGDVVYSYVRGR